MSTTSFASRVPRPQLASIFISGGLDTVHDPDCSPVLARRNEAPANETT